MVVGERVTASRAYEDFLSRGVCHRSEVGVGRSAFNYVSYLRETGRGLLVYGHKEWLVVFGRHFLFAVGVQEPRSEA